MLKRIAFLVCSFAFATKLYSADQSVVDATVSKTTAPSAQTTASTSDMISEAGMMASSVAGGSMFAGIGLMNEWHSGIGVGARGYLPMSYSNDDAQIYMGKLVSRFSFVNDKNQMYLEASAGLMVPNRSDNAAILIGGNYGYIRHFTPFFGLGAVLGADFTPKSLTKGNDGRSIGSELFSSASVVGNFYF